MTMQQENRITYRNRRKAGKPMGPGNPHLPNKAERKLLTTMMRDSGQSEEQVRASLSNRRKLAAAAKSASVGKSFAEKQNILRKRLRRTVIELTGLEHFDKRVNSIVDQYIGRKRVYEGEIARRFDIGLLEVIASRVIR